MATPSKRLLLSNLVTTLEGITTGNGYKTTIGSVNTTVEDWETARQSAAFPYIGMKPGRTEVVQQAFEQIRCSLPIQLVCHVNAATKTAAYDNLENLLDDIISVVSVDPTRGGNAVDTTYIGDETDEGDPDNMDSHGGAGTMVVELRILFYRNTSSS